MSPLHAKAHDLLGKVFRIYDGDETDQAPWDDSDLHELKDLSDAAGGTYLPLGRDVVDRLSQIRDQMRNGSVDRDFVACVASLLDDLATAAEHEGL